MCDTLVLNSDGRPISVMPISAVGWQLSVKLILLEKARGLEYYQDWVVHSPSMQINVPSVVMLNSYMKFSKKPRFNRYNIHLRDLFVCQYCGCEVSYHDATMDHVIPRSKGGTTDWLNIVTACKSCNTAKGSELAKPKKLPYQPNLYELENKRKRFPVQLRNIDWNTYLNWPKELIKVA
jgi:5-methylcytosine-specific restriction endonuclease McrA